MVSSRLRAIEYLPCFMASMARSNSTLSGCLESTLAIGFTTLLWRHPAENKATISTVAIRILFDIIISTSVSVRTWNWFLCVLQCGFRGQFQQLPRVVPGIAFAEYRVSGDQQFHSGVYRVPDGVGADAAIDLDPEIQAALGPHFDQLPHLFQNRRYELLSAKAGVHRHDENMIHHVEHLFEGRNRGGRVQHHARLDPLSGNMAQRPV